MGPSHDKIRRSVRGIVYASTAARVIAKREGIDLRTVPGSGKNGWITMDDVRYVLQYNEAMDRAEAMEPTEVCPECGYSEPSDGYGHNDCPDCETPMMEVAS